MSEKAGEMKRGIVHSTQPDKKDIEDARDEIYKLANNLPHPNRKIYSCTTETCSRAEYSGSWNFLKKRLNELGSTKNGKFLDTNLLVSTHVIKALFTRCYLKTF